MSPGYSRFLILAYPYWHKPEEHKNPKVKLSLSYTLFLSQVDEIPVQLF